MSLRLPAGRIKLFDRKLDRQLQNLRKQVSSKRITKGQAKDRGARIIKAHGEELIRFVRAYLRRKKVPRKFNNDDFRKETKETITSWNKIVDDM
jgi:hypothetical protein